MLRSMLWPRRIWWVSLGRHGLAGSDRLEADDLCSSCGAPTVDKQCSTCAAALGRHASAAFLLGAASVLLGVSAALVFPLLWPRAALGWHLLAACAAAFAPVAGLGSSPRPSALWGSPPTVWPLGVGVVVERRELAERLAAGRGRAARALWLPPIVYRLRWWTLPALALGLALLAHGWHHPRLWVINLTPEPLRLLVDGEPERALDPAGLDAARALAVVRLPRGEHVLAAVDAEGHVLGSVRVRLESGKDHLYAPASTERCFWLELTGYGKDTTQSVRPLVSEARFFTLDTDVDAWFGESHEPPGSDRRSSGGTLTALRQSPCARAPEAVRRATSAVGP
jgi:hypothetical protein